MIRNYSQMIRNLLPTFALIVLFSAFTVTPVFSQDDVDEDTPPAATNPKVKLGFYSHTGFYRQILMGFNFANATDAIDPGYDAVNIFDVPNDMYFYTQNTELFIQGVGAFDPSKSYPVGIQVASEGTNIIKFEGVENFPATQNFFLYDAQTGIFHNLKAGNLLLTLEEGAHNDRFFLTFQTQNVLGINDINPLESSKLEFATAVSSLKVSITENFNTTLQIFDSNGRLVQSKTVNNTDTIDLSQLNSGLYIATIGTANNRKSLKFVKK